MNESRTMTVAPGALSLGQKIDLCVAALPAQFRYVPDPAVGGDPMDGLYRGIREMAEHFKSNCSWVPVTERLPEDGIVVATLAPGDGEPDYSYDMREEGGWVAYENALEEYHAVRCEEMVFGMREYTHWMPLPPLPDSPHKPECGK